MSGYDNLLYSDQDSNDAIDHIPKTPGPVTVHERSEEEEAEDSNEDEDHQENAEHDSDHEASDSDKSDEVIANHKSGSDNDSEVERSDVENENENEAHDSDEHSDSGNASAKEEAHHNENEESKSAASANEESNDESGNEEGEEQIEVQSNKSLSPKRKPSDDSDEESSDVQQSPTKRLRIESDEEASNDAPKNETSTKAIFGDLSSEDEENEHREKIKEESNESHSDAGNEDDSMRNDSARVDTEMNENETFYDEEQQEQEPQIEETRIDVDIPRIVASLGKELYFVKLPNFLSVDTHPYDPSWYDEEGLDDEEGGYDDEGRARVKLKVENTMRWRNMCDDDGNIKRESNSRIVRWSDGSMSLHLGCEIFDIYKQQLMPGDNNHLFVRQGTGLQGQAVFKTKLTFRPHSTDSFTHRKMTLSLADRSQKTQKIRVLPTVGKDPEAHRSEMIKKEEDRLKASIRRENKMRRVRDRANTRGPTASYLEPDNYEEEDDEGTISLSAIKNKYKKGGPAYNVYTDSEEDDDSDVDMKRNKSEKKPKIVEESDED